MQSTKDNPLFFFDAYTLAKLVKTKQLSPVEIVRTHLERIEAINPKINAIVQIADTAIETAQKAEDAVMKGEKLGALHGVPFTAKDSIDTAKVLTQRGSPIFQGRLPVQDATSVARLKNAGGILLAKTNLPEFSYWIESDNLLTGRTNNPWDITKTPGGSSGGESAAIASGMSPLGLGTDLAISVRGPAAQTGISSLKATLGRIPMTGIWPRTPRKFWNVGPMARSIRDLELAYNDLLGPDPQDGNTINALVNIKKENFSKFQPLRIGWMTGPGLGPVDKEVKSVVKQAAEALQSIGVYVEEVNIPALEKDFALEVFNELHVMEMKPEFRKATAGFPPEKIYKMAQTMLSAPDTSIEDYVEAGHAAERIKDGYWEFFQKYDAIITQVLPIPAYAHGMETFNIDGQIVDATYIQAATVPLNLTGLPGISMRFGTSREGLPINIQIVGSWNQEYKILHIASLLENLRSVPNLHPDL
ncbi:amidase [Rhizosphaericola mali]|uniref:Amidase n=1 Tax=Rhizosphaericola mali TaxID=2545455 RepID=A0A5P2G5F5_9BACT|nr:amidase [Rhizosphaericola mali]QES88333.1 amidase [Rhizosphaericola mali]